MRSESTANLIRAGSSSTDVNRDVNFSINSRVRHSVSSDEEDDASKTNGCTNDADCCSSQPTGPIILDIEDLVASTAHRSPIKCRGDGGDGGFDSDATTAIYKEPVAGSSNGMCSSKFNCGGTSRQNCQSLIKEYQVYANNGLEPLEFPENVDEHQTMQHTVLLILLLCSIFVVSTIFFLVDSIFDYLLFG